MTLRALAAELGCSPMTPYRYFENKAELFAVVRADAFRRFAAFLGKHRVRDGFRARQAADMGGEDSIVAGSHDFVTVQKVFRVPDLRYRAAPATRDGRNRR